MLIQRLSRQDASGHAPASRTSIGERRRASYHPKEIAGIDGQCDVQHLATYDLVATERGVFLNSRPADALDNSHRATIGPS
jgi:hypothetical protein